MIRDTLPLGLLPALGGCTQTPSSTDLTNFTLFGLALVAVTAGMLIARSRRKLAEDLQRGMRALQSSEERYRLLLEQAKRSESRLQELFSQTPVAILEMDFSAVAQWIDELRAMGVINFSRHLDAHPDELARQFSRVKIMRANPAALRASGAPDFETYVAKVGPAVMPNADLNMFRLQLTALWQGDNQVVSEVRFARVDGTEGHGVMHWSIPYLDTRPDPSHAIAVFSDLSELRETEARLREVEDRWQLAVRALNVGIFEKNYRTGKTYLSDRWKEMIGFAPDELDDRDDWQTRIHPNDRDRVVAELQAHLRRENDLYRVEYQLLARDGTYKWISACGRAVFDAHGQPQRFIGAHTDISERKAAEDALRSSELRYRNLFENAAEGVYRTSASGEFRAVNPALARILGYRDVDHFLSAVKSVSRDFYVDPSRRAEFFQVLGQQDAVTGFESEVWTADHNVRWISENVRAIRDSAGEIAFFEGFVSDITDRKKAEAAMRASEAELASERERLRVTLRAMAEGLLTTDTDGVIQFMNEAAERLTGWTAGAAIGRSLEGVCVLRHEKTQASVPIPVGRAISEHRVIDFPLQTVLVGRQGPPCLIDGRCAPMHDVNGRAIGAVVVFRDVTERARLEAELSRSSKLEAVGILAGGIAHDFNNILTVVMGNVTLAMLDSVVMENAGRWLAEAERGVMRARDLTQQLLTFAKGGDPVRKAIHLPEVVQETAEFALHGSKVRCEFTPDPNLWAADVDKGQIGQVVQNLVINAVQAMPEGGVVKISLHNEKIEPTSPWPLLIGSYVRLEISDSGLGIRKDHLPRIFDPYFTTKQSGSGLGLATVYSIVRRHQGHIEVDSELGRGTTFRIWLPAAPDSKPVMADPPEKVTRLSGRVLFMDDEETIRTLAISLLTRLGLEVTAVSDGAEAIRQYEAARDTPNRFALVIMDLTVPGGVGGADAMSELLKIDPHVKAIVSSGYSSDPVLANYRAHGFRGMVPKPYRFADLARTIHAVMREGPRA